MFFIQQANNHDCGFTCFKILLANIHHDSNYLFLTDPLDSEVSFLTLMKEASKYHTELETLKAVNKDELRKCDKLPFIAHLNISNYSHAVYVYKISKKYVYYYDPSRGHKKLTYDEFNFLWTGEMLAIKQNEKFPCPIKKPSLMNMKEKIISLLISLVGAVSSVLAIYFINKESYIFLPIIFFTVMLISEIVLKKYSMVVMSHIDKRVEELTINVKNKDYYGLYTNYEGYKKCLLVNHLSTFSSFYIFLIISIVFIINDKINFIYIVLNLLLAATYAFLVKPMLDKDEAEIKENEEFIKRTKDKLEAFSYMDNARKIGYKYVDKLYAYKYVAIALEVILTFILMMYNSLVSVTYIICYTVLQVYLYSNIVNLLTTSSELQKQDNLLNIIINNIENK